MTDITVNKPVWENGRLVVYGRFRVEFDQGQWLEGEELAALIELAKALRLPTTMDAPDWRVELHSRDRLRQAVESEIHRRKGRL